MPPVSPAHNNRHVGKSTCWEFFVLTRTKLFLLIAAGVIWLAGTALLLHVIALRPLG